MKAVEWMGGKTHDFLGLLNAFLRGDAQDYSFYHCPLHMEHDLSLLMTKYEYYCFKCGKAGTYSSIKNFCRTTYKKDVRSFSMEKYDRSDFVFLPTRTCLKGKES